MRNQLKESNRISILSGLVAFLGIAAIAWLEIESYLSISQEEGAKWSIAGAIIFAGLGRWYMFYEGTALARYDKKQARTAFGMSIFLAASVLAYGIYLYLISLLKDHEFGLFMIANVTLIFSEFVFSKRQGFTKPIAVLTLEEKVREIEEEFGKVRTRLQSEVALLKKSIQEKGRKIQTLIEEIKTIQADNKRLRADQTSLMGEMSEQEERVREIEEKVPVWKMLEETYQNHFFIGEDGKKFTYCPIDGEKAVINSPKQKTLCCPDCNRILWEKENGLTHEPINQ